MLIPVHYWLDLLKRTKAIPNYCTTSPKCKINRWFNGLDILYHNLDINKLTQSIYTLHVRICITISFCTLLYFFFKCESQFKRYLIAFPFCVQRCLFSKFSVMTLYNLHVLYVRIYVVKQNRSTEGCSKFKVRKQDKLRRGWSQH